jgi:hypothetical protein
LWRPIVGKVLSLTEVKSIDLNELADAHEAMDIEIEMKQVGQKQG